jgi:hypothetical protein
MYLGGALIVVGILGSVVAFTSKRGEPSPVIRRSTNPFDEED